MMAPKLRLVTIFISSLFAIHNTTSCMDGYPQLQLEEPQKNPIQAARAKLQICSIAHYALSSCPDPNVQICFNGRPPRYINDPLIYVKLIFESNGNIWNDGDMYKIHAPLPAKQLFNLNDGSVIQFSIINAKKPNRSRFITATCQVNPKQLTKGKNFYEQFESAMANFYKKPITEEGHKQKLLDLKVVRETYENATMPGHPFPHIEVVTQHGARGCPDEKTLVKLITKPKIKPYGNSVYQFVTQRQLGMKQRPTITTDPDRILDNCLRVMELEIMAENNTLDQCFRELQISCLLTRLFIKNRITKLFIEFLARQR